MRVFLFSFILIMFSVQQSFACSNNETGQPGVAGQVEYFTAENEYKFCDGNNWRSFKLNNSPTNRNVVYNQDFESGLVADEWGADIVANYSQFLGRFPLIGGIQGPNRTFTLSGSQDTTVITFDLYRFDNFGSSFRVFLDDTQVIQDSYTSGVYMVPSGGTNGNVSWTVSTSTAVAVDFAYGALPEQVYTYTITITNPAATSMKLGFSATGYNGIATAAWGIDNFSVEEVTGGTPSTTYSENFESGLAPGDWGSRETITFSTFLGRFASTGNGQGPNKTISLSGTQDTTTITFDFYEIDSWDNEQFTVFIDDTAVFSENFSVGTYETPAGGTNGNVSWTTTNISSFLSNFGFGTWSEQTYRYTLTVTNPGATSIKIGFGNNLNEGFTNEAVGIDNISVVENIGGSPTTVFTEDFEAALPANDWGADISVTMDGLFGRYNGTGGVQGPSKTFALPGTQDTTTISFEFYELGEWESETFSVYIDDVAVITDTFVSNSYDEQPGGSSGNATWTVSNVTPISADFGFEGGFRGFDQLYTYTITLTNPGATSVKLGFGSNLSGSLDNESWAIDDLDVFTTTGGSNATVYTDDFETPFWPQDWGWDRAGYTYLTKFLGRFAGTGGAQGVNRTFTLSGTQDTTTIEFDFYEIDSWDNEAFRAFVNDTQIFSDNYRINVFDVPSSGTTGSVSYVGQNASGGTIDMGFTGTGYTDQITHYTLVVTNPTETSLKLGFGAVLSESLANESFGIDNVRIYETASGTDTLVYQDNFEGAVSGWSDNTSESSSTPHTTAYVLTKTDSESDYDLDFSATETLAPSSFALTTSEDGGANFTNFLGRFATTGTAQGPNKTFTLPGTQDITTLTFDVYEMDTWDDNASESLYIFIDDALVYTFGPLDHSDYDVPLGDTTTASKRLAFNLTSSLADLGYGAFNDQKYQFVFQLANPGATSVKLGFGSRLNENLTNEAWGIDNVSVVTHDLTAVAAFGSCSSARQLYYDSTNNILLWCDGTSLWEIADSSVTSGTCTTAGAFDFNATNKVFRYCNGTNWIEVGNEGFN